MKKKTVRLFGIICAIMMLAGCTNIGGEALTLPTAKPEDQVVSGQGNNENISSQATNLTAGKGGIEAETKEPTKNELAAISDASVTLFTQVVNNAEGENVLLSPTSIHFALGMTENGAAGKTLSQMEEVVNGGVDRDNFNKIMYRTSGKLTNAGDVEWNVANSIWMRDNGEFKLKDAFLDKVVAYYNAQVYKAPFNNQTVEEINGWVNENTKEMIPEILDTIPSEDVVMYLINAIAFDGEWAEQYVEDMVRTDRDFTNRDGSITKVTMLNSKEQSYFTLGKGQGFIKPYKGGEYSFVGILPDEGVSCEEYLKKLYSSGADFSKAVREASQEEVYVSLPEFSQDYGIQLSETYISLGMTDPFSQTDADFTEMLQTGNGDPYEVWISRILHKTHIEVDRKGTKAAAATAVEMYRKSAVVEEEPPKTIILNRPFIYAIVENETGLPIFLGCRNTMEK